MLLTLLLFPSSSFSKEPELKLGQEKAFSFLKKALSKYQTQSTQFKIEKQLYLPLIDETIKETGSFYIEKQKFRLSIKGNPAYLMIFDGDHLWYQSDIKEKIVFKLKDHPQIYLFFQIFNSDSFFEHFSIEKFTKKNKKKYSFYLKSNQNIEGISEIFIVVGNYIEEIKISWEDLGQWQRYKFINPWVKKKISKSKFKFSGKNFEVISTENL